MALAFAARLAAARDRSGLTQAGLADAAGVSQKAVSRWEAGECLPRWEQLAGLVGALGVRVADLLPD